MTLRCSMFGVLVIVLASVGGVPSQAAQSDTLSQGGNIRVRYGQIDRSVTSFSSLALYIAQSQGFLTQHGIDLDVIPLPGEGAMIDALDEDQADLVHVASPYLILRALAGSDAVAVVGGPANTINSLIARPEIRSYDDLRGKVIALTGPQDTLSIGMRMLLAKHGIADSDFRMRDLRGSNVRFDCLAGGDCDAVVLSTPADLTAVADGYIKLGDSFEVIPELQFNVVAARRDWAAGHRDAVVRFAGAFAEAYRFMRDPAHRDEVIQIMVNRMALDPSIARELLVFSFEPDRGVMPRAAEINLAGLKKVIELLGQAGELEAPLPAAERFVDLQYLQAAGVR